MCRAARRGFTLIELLVVVAIIAVLVGLLLPAVQKVREAAARARCQNNLAQIGKAVHNHESARGQLPHAYFGGSGEGTWAMHLLPHLEQGALFEMFAPFLFTQGTWYLAPQAARETQVPTYYCPTRRAAPQLSAGEFRFGGGGKGALGDYAANMGPSDTRAADGGKGPLVWYGGLPANPPAFRTRFADVVDGTSQVLMVGEKQVAANPAQWGTAATGDDSAYNDDNNTHYRLAGPGFPLCLNPADQTNAGVRFGGPHPGVVQFVSCDGGVRPLRTTIDVTNLGRLSNRLDGEPITADY